MVNHTPSVFRILTPLFAKNAEKTDLFTPHSRGRIRPHFALTGRKNCAIVYVVKGCDEDTRKSKLLREETALVKGFCNTASCDTTSEPWERNVPSGTPVKASMSDGNCRNQGGTVEYFVSHP